MNSPLFVYGTLRRDIKKSRFSLLSRYAAFLGYGHIQGCLYDLGPYPGIVLCQRPRPWVRGEIYRLEPADEALRVLDDYEGCGPANAEPRKFIRQQGEAILDDGSRLLVWVYVYCGSLIGSRQLSSGDYQEG